KISFIIVIIIVYFTLINKYTMVYDHGSPVKSSNSALPVQTTCFYVSPTDKGLDRLSDGSFLFSIIIVVLLMYFFWCTKYLINAPLGELKKKKNKKIKK